MKIRLILLSIVGLAAYIALASFNSKIIRESETPKGQITAPQTHAVQQPAAAPGQIAAAPQPPQPSQTQPVDESSIAGKLQRLQDELARKDRQIKQLLDAQESIVARERAARDATAGAAESTEKSLAEKTKRIEALSAAQDQMAAELDRTTALVEQLRREIGQQRQHATETADKTLKEQTDTIAALTADRDKNIAELQRTRAELEQLRHQVAAMQTAGAQTEQANKEKEALLAAAQQQLQSQIEASNQLKAQLAATGDQLAATKNDLAQAQHQAEELVRQSTENEQRTKNLNEQKTAVEQELAEKREALDKAVLTIQSLKQEVIAQPQAVATVQALLDERTREFDRASKEAAATIEQLIQQVATLGKNTAQTAKELERCTAEADKARKEKAELEADRTKAQSAKDETERNLAAVMEHSQALQAQLQEKGAALAGIQAKLSELTAAAASLRDEKIGLASQLAALQTDYNGLLAMKNSFAEQAAALAKAESSLKEMPALRTKTEEMSKSLTEKDAALARAAQQAEANAAAGKQLEQEKADLAGQLAAAQALAHSVDGLKKTIDEKTDALALAEVKARELDSVKEQVAAAQAKVDAAQAAQLTAEKSAAEGATALQRCNESLSANSGAMHKLESELGEAQARIKELSDTHQQQAQQDPTPALRQEIATLRGQVEAMKAAETNSDAVQAVNQKAQILQTERDGLQQALTASQATVADLQQRLEAAKAAPPLPAAQAGPADRQAAGTNAGKDGVAAGADLCPEAPAGAPVNALGCPREKAIVLEGIVFASGTATLTPESQKALDRIAAALVLAPRVKLEVAGYTDSVGDDRRNRRLSAQRAQAVAAYLTGKGVAAARLTANGYGAENPIGDNATAEGRQKNRRIELHVLTH